MRQKRTEKRACEIADAIRLSHGLLTSAAERLGISRQTVWNYMREFPSVKNAVDEARECVTDLAESQLYKKIAEGDLTAIIFYLKTRGKARGYVERQELTGRDGQELSTAPVINVVSSEAKTLVAEVVAGAGTDGNDKSLRTKPDGVSQGIPPGA